MDLSHLNNAENQHRKKAILNDAMLTDEMLKNYSKHYYQKSLRDGGSIESDSVYLENVKKELENITVNKSKTKKKKK